MDYLDYRLNKRLNRLSNFQEIVNPATRGEIFWNNNSAWGFIFWLERSTAVQDLIVDGDGLGGDWQSDCDEGDGGETEELIE